ncbi:hypothetical protein GCM10009090_29880 [[Pseudomonas] boreopolis]|uniref:Uncharacterized protein n=1 Tax=Xanthomonas boreopolis TaxID=86183 RepID=A0A919FA39_9XANT|nr:hypothetical protein GCM10009090_29880 [[Pseudomonas] boreopolis]
MWRPGNWDSAKFEIEPLSRVRERDEGAGRSLQKFSCPRLRPYPHPPLRGTFSRVREKGTAGALQRPGLGLATGDSAKLENEPLSRTRERGWGEGAGRGLRKVQLPEASPVPSSAPAGHLLPCTGEGNGRRSAEAGTRFSDWGTGKDRDRAPLPREGEGLG